MKKYNITAAIVVLLGAAYILTSQLTKPDNNELQNSETKPETDSSQPSVNTQTTLATTISTLENSNTANTIAPAAINQKTNSVHSADETIANKRELFKSKNEKIVRDEYGNTLVNVSTDGFNSKEIIISNSQVFYPTEEQLNNGVEGCAVGGYYVELNTKLSMIVKTEETNTTYNYSCAHNSQDNSYYLADSTTNPAIEQSVNAVINKPYNE